MLQHSSGLRDRELLAWLSHLKGERNLWMALPGELERWWRARARMRLEERHGHWTVSGEGSEQASIAYLGMEDGRLTITLPPAEFQVVDTA